MLLFSENPEDNLRISLIGQYQFRPSRTNVRFLPRTATYIYIYIYIYIYNIYFYIYMHIVNGYSL